MLKSLRLGEGWVLPSPTQAELRLLRVVSIWVLSLSKDEGSTASLGNMFQRLPSLTGKKIFLCLNGISFNSSLVRQPKAKHHLNKKFTTPNEKQNNNLKQCVSICMYLKLQILNSLNLLAQVTRYVLNINGTRFESSYSSACILSLIAVF